MNLKNLAMQPKFIGLMRITSLTSLLITACFSAKNASGALLKSLYNQLTAMRDILNFTNSANGEFYVS